MSNISMTIGGNSNEVYVKGQWMCPKYGWNGSSSTILGSWSFPSDGNLQGIITPKSIASTSYGDGPQKESLVSYEALVIPQTINAGVKLFVIDIKGYSQFYYKVPTGGIEWKAGTEHTYNITIEGSKLSVTTSESIGWGTDGASGSGSVTLPEIIDLSTGSTTINDDGVYRIQGNGGETTNTITISSGSPTVYLENVNIEAATTGGINITGGSPTLIIQGTGNKIVSQMDSGIALSNGASVTITGTKDDKLTVEGGGSTATAGESDDLAQGAGIGSAKGATCGNITIENIQLVAKGSSRRSSFPCGGTAIGTSYNGSCGNITIKNATIEASAGSNTAAIGVGEKGESIGEIQIQNSTIIASSTNGAACIGFSNVYDTNKVFKAGKITIITNDISGFLSNLTIDSSTPHKVGKSTSGVYQNKEGTGAWEGVYIIVDGKTTHYADGVSEIQSE